MGIRICHLTSVHPAKDGRIFHKECISLAQAGYDVTLVAAGAEDEICNDIRIVGVPITNIGRVHRMLNVSHNVYKKALEIDAEIYHFHDPELLPYGLKLKRRGKKVIFDSHEFVGEQILTKTYIPKIFRKGISNIYKYIEAVICKKLDGVIEVCTIDGRDYFDGRCKRKVFVTNAPIITNTTKENTELKSCESKVVHVGSLTFERGITYLSEAIKLSDCKLILAGKFSGKNYEEEIKRICGNKLDYRGIVPLNEISSLLHECKIGVSTLLPTGQYNHIDVLPTKIYDYMYAGLPIIMSSFPFLEEFNRKYKVGLCVAPDNPKAIADAIDYLISHPEEAKKMGENGQKVIATELNWNIEEKKLLAFYNELLNC